MKAGLVYLPKTVKRLLLLALNPFAHFSSIFPGKRK